MAGEIVQQLRQRSGRRLLVPPPARGHRRRGQVPRLALDPTAFVIHGHRQEKPVPGPRPTKSRRRRGRVPDLAFDPTAFVVGRHRVEKPQPAPPPAKGRRLRHRLPPTGLPQAGFDVHQLRHRTGHQPKGPPPAAGHRRRGRLPHLGLTDLASVPIRRQSSGTIPAQIAARLGTGRTVRRPVPGLGLDPTAFVVGRHRVEKPLPAPPPAKARRHRGQVPLTGLGDPAGSVVRLHHRKQLVQLHSPPPAKGRRRKGRVPGLGLDSLPIVQGRRVPRGLWPTLAAQRPHSGRRRWLQLAGSGVVAGPYSVSAAQLYVAGAVAGGVEPQ